jgi:hypothetical protein
MIRRATATLDVPMGRRLDWRSAATARLRPVGDGDSAPPTTVALLADTAALTVRFTCRATRLNARMLNDGDPLYLEDVVEVFLWPGNDPAVYLEYEVSPLGRDLCRTAHPVRRAGWRGSGTNTWDAVARQLLPHRPRGWYPTASGLGTTTDARLPSPR